MRPSSTASHRRIRRHMRVFANSNIVIHHGARIHVTPSPTTASAFTVAFAIITVPRPTRAHVTPPPVDAPPSKFLRPNTRSSPQSSAATHCPQLPALPQFAHSQLPCATTPAAQHRESHHLRAPQPFAVVHESLQIPFRLAAAGPPPTFPWPRRRTKNPSPAHDLPRAARGLFRRFPKIPACSHDRRATPSLSTPPTPSRQNARIQRQTQFSTYHTSSANLSCQLAAFLPFTCAHPVIPGFTSCRRISSAL